MTNLRGSQIPSRRIAAGLAVCAFLSAPAFAGATTTAPDQHEAVEAVQDVQSALADLRADGEMTGKVIADSGDVLPDSASEPIELADVSIGLPVRGESKSVGNNVVFDGPKDTTVVAQMTAGGGARALVSLDSPASPDRYRFPIEGASRLVMQSDGSVIAYSGDEAIGQFDAPWARDANGISVPTRYEIDGATLVQVVDHAGGNFAYPIIADPWWNPFSWNWSGAARTVGRALISCGQGALAGPIAVGGQWTYMAVRAYQASRTVSLVVPGGQAWFLSGAVVGCLGNVLRG